MVAKKRRLERSVREELATELRKIPYSSTKVMPVQAMSGNVGQPDIYFTCRWINGLSVWIEAKRPGAREQRHEGKQEHEQGRLERAGCVVLRRVENVGMLRRLMAERLGIMWESGEERAARGVRVESGEVQGAWRFDSVVFLKAEYMARRENKPVCADGVCTKGGGM